MATVEFIYDGETTSIQCKVEDKIEEIVNRFLDQKKKEKGSIFFLYSGQVLDEDLSFIEALTRMNKGKNIMIVQAWDLLLDTNKKKTIIKSKYVICPKCNEHSLILLDQKYQISLYECKNEHKINDI